MQIKACAKLNLYLNIIGVLPDGYHELCSVMQAISLSDDVFIEKSQRITLSCDKAFIPTDDRNVAFKAAKLFFEHTGIKGGASIKIKKNIPVGAGMAGGSTDAAAVLKGLNELYGANLSQNELIAMGAEVGADVPFCIVGGTALCEGKGEKVRALPKLKECAFVIVKPQFSVSTPQAYAEYDKNPGECPPAQNMINALQKGDLHAVCESVGNALEAPVANLHREIYEIKKKLLMQGAMTAQMTGSGSAVFGIFPDQKKARAAATALRSPGNYAYTALCE